MTSSLLKERTRALESLPDPPADVLMSNTAMLKVFRRGAGHDLHIELDDGVYEVRMMFTDPPEAT